MRELTNEEIKQVSGGNRTVALGMSHMSLPIDSGFVWIVTSSLTETTSAINNIDMKQQLGPEAS